MAAEEKVSHFNLTKGGLFFAIITVAFIGSAFNLGSNMTYLLASLLMAMLIIAFIAPSFSLRGTHCARRIPEPPRAGEPYLVELVLRRPKATWTARLVEIEDPLCEGRPIVLQAPARQEVIVAAAGKPQKRGAYPMPSIAFRTGFPFGLTECKVVQKVEDELVVYPYRGELGRVVASSLKPLGVRQGTPSRSGMPGEDIRTLREYVPGDNPRWIHWRASAHLGKLHVRELERERTAPVLVLLDSRIPASLSQEARKRAEEALEVAISFASEACRVSLREGSSARLVAFFPEPRVIIGSSGAEPASANIRVFLDALARLTPSTSNSAGALIEPALTAGIETAWRVLAVTPTPETANSFAAALGSYGRDMLVASSPGFGRIFRLSHLQEEPE